MSDKKEPQNITKAKVNLIYFGMFMTLMTTLVYPTIKQLYPELLETEKEHQMIKDEAENIALNFPTLMREKHDAEAKALSSKLNVMNNKIIQLKSTIHLMSEDLQSYKIVTDGLHKQIKFNTYNTQNNTEALFDLMNVDDKCKIVRYTRNKVDRYVLFHDWYESTTLQQIIAGSGCRITVVPFDRNRIKL